MDIRLLEECSFRALPALETQHYDGWVVRFANGYTRRANSINVIDESRLSLDEKIAYCERYYAERANPTHFRLTPLSQSLESTLRQRGYTDDGIPTLVQTVDLVTVPTQMHNSVQILPLDAWFDIYTHLNGTPVKDQPTFKQVLSKIDQPSCFLTLCEDGDYIAAGLGVLDSGLIGLFDIVVREDQRGRGLGKSLVSSLLHWGKTNGAQTSYLQVVSANSRAIKLYEKLGYQTRYSYLYLSKA